MPLPSTESKAPGLILLQVDGLSRKQFERAAAAGRLRFLRRLVRRRHFTLKDFYSGVPSTTPAVQGEIFYGVRAVVPGFHFLDRQTGRDFSMYDAESARRIEEQLAKEGEPLLAGGHGYSNVYRAGAAKTRYCSQDLAPNEFFRGLTLWRWLILLTLHLPRVLRIVWLAFVEFLLAVFDMICGQFKGEDALAELKFVPARVAVGVVLREMIRFRVLLDIEAGVRVIHANFLGYDEQSHRRGPGSAFAHWTLLGIDRAIRDFQKAARDCDARDYELMIYSDHGQEHCIPYERATGRSLLSAVEDVFAQGPMSGTPVAQRQTSMMWENLVKSCRASLGFNRHSDHWQHGQPDRTKQIFVAAMGPLGHIYFPKKLSGDPLAEYARQLVASAKIPLVMYRDTGKEATGHEVRAFTRAGEWWLPQDRAQVLGNDHPFLDQVARDLVNLFDCKYTGDLVISGWRAEGQPMTFPMENGAHAGPGSEETRGFLLIPDRLHHWHVHHFPEARKWVRGDGLHRLVRHYLGRDGQQREESVAKRGERHQLDRGDVMEIRVMTYNIHSCLGVDGKLRSERIARVINGCNADLIGVQEIDCHRVRSAEEDQSQVIASHLRMHHVFKTMLEEEHHGREQYGIGVFSRFPIEMVKSDLLTVARIGRHREARGAIWVKVDIGEAAPVHFITTHFGLSRKERVRQMDELVGDEWIGAVPEDEPLMVCGDFNSTSSSVVMERLRPRLRDVQQSLTEQNPKATFPASLPLLRLDHIFVSRHFGVRAVEVADTATARVASDHRPVCVQLRLSVSK